MRRILLLCLSPLLAGCWTGKSDFYAGEKPVTPFRAGLVKSVDAKGEVVHFELIRQDGTYTLLGAGKDADDDGFRFRLYPLPGSRSWVFDAVTLDNCKPDGRCDPVKPGAPHMYGLLRQTAHDVEEINPDCDAAMAKKLGARLADSYGACEFSTRALLEKALKARDGGKPDARFTYE